MALACHIGKVNASLLTPTPHTSHLTSHTSHLTPHTSHLTPHNSHLTPHTLHLTGHPTPQHGVITCDFVGGCWLGEEAEGEVLRSPLPGAGGANANGVGLTFTLAQTVLHAQITLSPLHFPAISKLPPFIPPLLNTSWTRSSKAT